MLFIRSSRVSRTLGLQFVPLVLCIPWFLFFKTLTTEYTEQEEYTERFLISHHYFIIPLPSDMISIITQNWILKLPENMSEEFDSPRAPEPVGLYPHAR